MKTAFKKSLALVLAAVMLLCALPFTASAQTYSGTCGSKLTWSLDTDTGVLNITGTGAMTNYTYFSNAPWYSYSSNIKTVNIASSVTTIGNYAFAWCTSLTSVTIGNSVTTIGYGAFYNCTSLTSVTIPDSVTTIGYEAFYGCTGLTSVTIPDSVTTIGEKAFYGCTSLTSVTIPDSVTTIGDYAFYGCTSLTSVIIPDSVTTIGNRAFYDCDSLTSVIIPDSVTSIGSNAFSPITVVICNKGSYAFQYAVENSVPYMFADGTKEENTLSGSVGKKLSWSIDKATRKLTVENEGTMVAFVSESAPWSAYKEYILYAEIKYGCTNISDSAFGSCRYLKAVDIPYSVTTIGDSAFYSCYSLTSVTIPDSVTSIGDYAFWGCNSLTSITIPDSVITIGERAFYGCDSLTSVTIGDSVKTIGDYAFWGCNSLTSVTIGDSVKTIGDYAFCNCDSLTSVTIPDSVTTIGENAFSSCDSLTSVTIGNSVTSIGEEAFYNCDSLTSVTIGNSVTTIGEEAFRDCDSLTSVTIPDSVTSIDSAAFESCDSLSAVTVGSGAKTINDYAFANCAKLYDIYIYRKTCTIYESSITINATIHGYAGSTAETFADKYGYNFEPIVDNLCDVHTYTDTCDTICDVCGAKREITHSYGEWTVTKEPTCHTLGTKQHVCSVCGYTQSDSVPKLDEHVYTDTCDPSCNVCGEPRDVNHSYGEWTITKEPTCAQNGIKQHVCSVCGTTETDYIAKLTTHTYTDSCDADCNVCGKGRDITHSYGEWTVTKEPTCAQNGTKQHTCSVCGAAETDYIAKLTIHTYTDTCDTDCNVCGKSREASHSYGEWTVTKEPTCNTLGTKQHTCSVCGATETDYVAKKPHTYTDADDTECDVCGQSKDENNTVLNTYGICGENLTWSLDENGTLTIEGTGAMYNFNGGNYIYVDSDTKQQVAEDTEGSIQVCRWNLHTDKIKKVVTGDGVTAITAYAFLGCNNLEKVYVPDIVISIDPFAFDGCGKAAIVCKNGSYANAFAAQNGVKYILEDSANGTAFEIKNGMLLGYNGTAHNIVLPSDITFVGPDAFKANSTVEFIEIPYNVAKIYGGAFANCANLDGVVIPFTVTDIDKSAFADSSATIYCYYKSYAHDFAVANGIDYELITITLDTTNVNLFTGDSIAVNAEPSIALASGVPMVWQSLNTDVATVDANGNITANSVGTATITVQIEGTAVSNSIDVQVLAEEYTITWVVDSKETKQTYKLGDEITAPDAPAKSGYTFTGWDKAIPANMPAENLTFTAQFELIVKELAIKQPSVTTINYGETLVLQLEDVELPEGWRVEWSLTGNSVTMSVSEDGKECRVTSTASGNVSVTATLVGENGEPVLNELGNNIESFINLSSKAGFWQKLVSFFKNLFRINRIIY